MAVFLLVSVLFPAATWYWLQLTAPGNPFDAELDEANRLIVRDDQGRRLWTFALPEGVVLETKRRDFRPAWEVADLDGDGRREVVVMVKSRDMDMPGGNRILGLSDGKVLWEYFPGKSVRWADLAHPTPTVYRIWDFELGRRSDGSVYVAVASNCPIFSPGQVSVLNKEGLVGDYLHTGYVFDLETLDVDDDGEDEILIGGINNLHRFSPFLAVVDPLIQNAISPTPDGYDPDGRRLNQELLYVILPRSDVADALDTHNRVFDVGLLPRASQISLQIEFPHDQDVFERAYTFDYRLRPLNLEFSHLFRQFHRELFESGKLDHDLTREQETAEKRQLMKVHRIVDRFN